MINASNAFREKLEAGEPVRMVVDITFPDGTKKTIDEEIMNGDNGFADCAESSSFPVGTSVCKTLTLNINNYEEQWKEYDFYSAKIHAYLKINGLAEKIDKGIYTITTPEQYSDIITITALDDMYKANKAYTSGLKLPQSLINLVRDACETIGIGMNLTMSHGDIIIRSIPDNMTFRQLFEYAAMVESANARIDYSGNLGFIKWDFEKADIPDLKNYGNPPALSSDDIIITGIRVKNGQSNDDTDSEYSGMYGKEGYLLELENELIDSDQLETVASIIGEQIVGARFRNLEGDLVYNPLVEFGDMVYTYDRLGNKYLTPLTDVSGNVGGLTTVKTQADDPIRGSSDFYGNSTKAIVAARQMVQKETSAREEAIQRLAETLRSSSGLYMTQEPQQDGSIIYYMHNKPTIKESNIIWKLTAEAFAVSIDGGKTYPYGFAVTGELITRLLYAEGINADYINAGTLIVRDKSGNVIFEADMDTGSVTLDGSYVTIGGKPLDEKIEDVENMAALARNMTMQLDNDYQGIPVDSDGNYTEFPECTTTATVMYGTQDITDNCTYTITTSQNIQGNWNKETKTYTVTGLTADSGWVNIKAAYLNNLVVSKQFSLAKQYAGPQGIPGVGTDGKTQYTHLAYANSADGKTDFSVSDGNREYIGMYVDFVEADSTDPTKYTWSLIKGADGAQGVPGTPGANGKTPYFHIAYANSADGRTDFSVSDGNREYIGMYVDFVEADSTDPTKYTWSLIKGADGAQGVPGTPGANGKTPYFHIAYANSADGRTGFSVDDSVNKLYIGQYTDYTPDDSTDPARYSWTKIKGEQGTAGRTYFMRADADILLMGAGKKITPNILNLRPYYRDGQEDAKNFYAWWTIEKSVDNGSSWEDISTYSTSMKLIQIQLNALSLEAHDMIRASAYADKEKTILCDQQTFPVALDASALSQKDIVEILSNNGAWKGLYYLNNELYVSFNAALGGTLTLGGQNNGNGLLTILDDEGSEIGRMSSGGTSFRNSDNNIVIRINNSGMFFYDSTGQKRKVLTDSSGITMYTDYTDANNWKAIKIGKYGIYAAEKSGVVEELWMDGDTSHKWDGYILRFLNGAVRLNSNTVYTDGCSMGKNLTTSGTLSVSGDTGLKGDAYVAGNFSFRDYKEEEANTSTRRRPVSSASAVLNRVAYLSSATRSNKAALTVSAQWGSSNYTTNTLYNDSASDIRLKENVLDCEINALDAVCKMPVCSFDWKETGVHQPLGLVADDIEKIDPLLALGGGENEDGSMNVKQIDRLLLTEYAIKAIQELSAVVKKQGDKIRELEEKPNGN